MIAQRYDRGRTQAHGADRLLLKRLVMFNVPITVDGPKFKTFVPETGGTENKIATVTRCDGRGLHFNPVISGRELVLRVRARESLRLGKHRRYCV